MDNLLTENLDGTLSWSLNFCGPRNAMLCMAAELKRWADENGMEFSYTNIPDNQDGLPVLTVVAKLPEVATNET